MILVTGASGALGGLIVERLTAAGAAVIAGTRTPGGPESRLVDFDRTGTLAPAFSGVDVLVMVSAGYAEDDVVLARHGAAIDAATAAGVRHVVYTSLVGSGDHLTIALAHRWTEARLAEAPFDVTVLRNGLYAELAAGFAHTHDLPVREHQRRPARTARQRPSRAPRRPHPPTSGPCGAPDQGALALKRLSRSSPIGPSR